MVVVEIMVEKEGHVEDVAVVGAPGEELKIVIIPEVNRQVVILTEVIIAASTKKTGKCDVCAHMVESRDVLSQHFKKKTAISGHNVHLQATEKPRSKWIVYL